MNKIQSEQYALDFQYLIGSPIPIPGFVIESIEAKTFKLSDGSDYHTVIYKSTYLNASNGDGYWGFLPNYCKENNIPFPKKSD
jgi:hypothetical protein